MVVAGTRVARKINSERKRVSVRESTQEGNVRMVRASSRPTTTNVILDEYISPFVTFVALCLWTLVALELAAR